MIDYVIQAPKGYTNKIGELVSMLEYTRAVTLEEVAELSQNDLDYLDSENSNTIAALLSHIAAIEKVHQVISFENRDFNQEELVQWDSALALGEEARRDIKGNSLDYYLKQLAEVRKETLTQLKTKDDAWLYEQKTWPNGVAHNNYYLWFHVMEDEISHRGQIKVIKRGLSKS